MSVRRRRAGRQRQLGRADSGNAVRAVYALSERTCRASCPQSCEYGRHPVARITPTGLASAVEERNVRRTHSRLAGQPRGRAAGPPWPGSPRPWPAGRRPARPWAWSARLRAADARIRPAAGIRPSTPHMGSMPSPATASPATASPATASPATASPATASPATADPGRSPEGYRSARWASARSSAGRSRRSGRTPRPRRPLRDPADVLRHSHGSSLARPARGARQPEPFLRADADPGAGPARAVPGLRDRAAVVPRPLRHRLPHRAHPDQAC